MKKTYKLLLLALLVSQTSCDLESEVYSFDQPDQFFDSENSAQLALNGAYDILQNGGYLGSYIEINEVASEFYTPSSTNAGREDLDNFRLRDNTGYIGGFWNSAYDGINRANTVIDRTAGIGFANEANKQRIIAEARFLRGMHYFNLARFFGGVPLRLNETTSLNDIRQARVPLEEIYSQAILPDLQFAVDNLPLRSKSKLGAATKGAAQTLLAKVYMTRGNWAEAKTQIEAVINSGEYALLPDYASLWNGRTENSKEIVFAVQFSSTPGENSNLLTGSLAPQGSKLNFQDGGRNLMVEMPFFNNFPNDARRPVTFLTEYTLNGKVVKFPDFDQGRFPQPSVKKFFLTPVTPNENFDFPMLRYADVLLMHAETLNEVGKAPSAQAYASVNAVRKRAGLENLPAGLSYQAFSDAVFQERRWELAFEGHGLVDMYRTKRLERIEAIAASSTTPPNNVKIEPRHYLLPIPFLEIQASGNLIEQNPGY